MRYEPMTSQALGDRHCYSFTVVWGWAWNKELMFTLQDFKISVRAFALRIDLIALPFEKHGIYIWRVSFDWFNQMTNWQEKSTAQGQQKDFNIFPNPRTYFCDCFATGASWIIKLFNFFLPPYAAAWFEPTSVELHQTGTFEGRSTDWLSHTATAGQ